MADKHAFSHLGEPPYKFLGYEQKRYQACAGAPIQVGGSCDHCGTGIIDTYYLESADGKTFHVGSTCIAKAGDRGLLSAIKPTVNKIKKERRDERNRAKIEAARELLPQVEAYLAGRPHPKIESRTRLDYVQWLLANAGTTGKLKAAKFIELAVKIVKETP